MARSKLDMPLGKSYYLQTIPKTFISGKTQVYN